MHGGEKAKMPLTTSKAIGCVVCVVLFSYSSNSLVLMHGYSLTDKKGVSRDSQGCGHLVKEEVRKALSQVPFCFD